jgi:hypothetical protein
MSPTVPEALKALLSLPEVEARPGLSPAEVAQLEGGTGLVFPQAVRDLYAAADGIDLGSRGRILPLREALSVRRALDEAGLPREWGYLPVLDLRDSNYHCVACSPPLSGRIVHVRHDDSATVCSPDLWSLVDAVRLRLDVDPEGLDELDSPYLEPGPRSEAEVTAGLELLALGRKLDPDEDEVARRDAFRFGIALLPPERSAEVARLLEEDDPWIREDAEGWLASAGGAESEGALERLVEERFEFHERCRLALAAEGFCVPERHEQHDDVLTVRSVRRGAPLHLNLAVFFGRRSEPGIVAEIVALARRLLASP